MISPYQMMGAPAAPQGQPMGYQPMAQPMPQRPPMQNPMATPPDFTRTAAGPEPGKKLSAAAEALGAEISDLTLAQAKLKHEKDTMVRQKSALEDIVNRFKGTV